MPRPASRKLFPGVAGWLVCVLASCAPEAPEARKAPEPKVDDLNPPTARRQQADELKADLAAVRHPSDGGGTAELIGDSPLQARAGEPGTWTIRYTVGPEGLAAGGAVYFMPEPFWGWSQPQDVTPRRDGYCVVSTDAEEVELTTTTFRQILQVQVDGRAMTEGETIEIVYGAEGPGAFADTYAERDAHLWISVDGDGDGVRQVLADSPTVDMLPGAAARVVLHGPSVVRPGTTAHLTVAVLDRQLNLVPDFEGAVNILGAPEDWNLTPPDLSVEDGGRRRIEFRPSVPRVVRLTAQIELENGVASYGSNPIWINPDAPLVRWADLHGHSNYSDGTGLPEDYFRYARDVAALDAVALTDHDHFGTLFLDQHPEMWEDIQTQVRTFHAPESFVTLLGYEWTSWIHGHRHVVYFEDAGTIYSSLDERYETPRQLWDALRGTDALTFAHHSAGEPVATNWSFRPDPELEPVTEITSVHGTSEAADCPSRVRGALPGNFVRDVIDRGDRLGFIGSGDSHDGHPGLSHLAPVYGYRNGGERVGQGGLAAILTPQLTRAGILEALRARRVYATSGPRMILHVDLSGRDAGSPVVAAELGDGPARLSITAFGASPLSTLDVVRSGEIVERYDLTGEWDIGLELPVRDLRPGEYLYVRIGQEDGALAWSSPIFVD